MTASRILTIVLGVAAAAAVIYALSLVPSSRKPADAPPKIEAPPPPAAEAPPPVAAPRAPIAVAPPPATRAPIARAPDPAPAPPSAPVTIESLHITDAEKAEIKPIILGVRDRSQRMMAEVKTGKLSLQAFDDARHKAEAEANDELSRVLGTERAKQFIQLSRGRLPDGYDQRDPAEAPPPQ